MQLTTAPEMCSIPIFLALALANDGEDWTVQLYAPGPEGELTPDLLLSEGIITEASTWEHAVLTDEDYTTRVVVPWDTVGTVHVP